MELEGLARRRRRAIAVVVSILVALILVRVLFGTAGLGILAALQVVTATLFRMVRDFLNWRKRRRPITPDDRERRLWEREERRHARARALRLYGNARSGSPRNG